MLNMGQNDPTSWNGCCVREIILSLDYMTSENWLAKFDLILKLNLPSVNFHSYSYMCIDGGIE